MKKDVDPRDKKGYTHGYQERYQHGKLWLRGNAKHNLWIGYIEFNLEGFKFIGEEGTKVGFNIR